VTPTPRSSRALQPVFVALLVVLGVVFVAIVLTLFIAFEPTRVSGDSMVPSLLDGDYILVTHGYHVAVRGDIVVFREIGPTGPSEVVKRVVAVPGDTVTVVDGVAKIDGGPEIPKHAIVTGGGGSFGPTTVPPGRIYVLGDNRPASYDSRFRGPIPLSSVIGRAVALFSPPARFQILR
jgi:signal peptidase I